MSISESVICEFERVLGAENVLRGEAERQSYAYDAALPGLSHPPALALRPESVGQLGEAVRLAYEAGIPMTVRGAGTCLCGGAVCGTEDGIVIVTTGLDRIVEINERNGYAVVEAGVRAGDFAKAVEQKGLFFPPDPGSLPACTLGGAIAENSGGARGLKYGTVKNYVLGLDFFTCAGELARTGARTPKCATGYDLTPLMVGSEGTLGVIARATLKLIPRPEASKTVWAMFSDIADMCAASADILSMGVVPARMEGMDALMLRPVAEAAQSENGQCAGALLVEVDGCLEQAEKEAAKVVRCCKRKGTLSIQVAENAKDGAALWQAHAAILRVAGDKGRAFVLEDATVPRTRIPELGAAIRDMEKTYALDIGVFGHMGDGTMHPVFLFDRRDAAQWERVRQARERLIETALSLDGTLCGEFGAGVLKAALLEREMPPATLALYKSIKKTMDPKHLFNPGKIILE